MPKARTKRHYNRLALSQADYSLSLIYGENSSDKGPSDDFSTNKSKHDASTIEETKTSGVNVNEIYAEISPEEISPPPDEIISSYSAGFDDEFHEILSSETDQYSDDNQTNNVFPNKNVDANVNKNSLQFKLATWAIEENIPQNKFKKLLGILRTEEDYTSLSKLPKDPRTLLHTPRKVEIKNMQPTSSGSFYYFGISSSINALICKYEYKIPQNSVFEVAVNVDGLPISKSSGSSLWPILIQIKSIEMLKNHVIMVGLYHGNEKPHNSNEFLNDFVNESIDLIENGLLIISDNIKCNFQITMLVCDTPAKSFVLCIKGHTANYCCPKCNQRGARINHVLCFPDTDNLVLRTDKEFRLQANEEHHNGVSILTKLPKFDLIQSVPLDYMHLICLGVMKRLFLNKTYGWIAGKKPHKLSYGQTGAISAQLVALRKFISSDFSRKTRSLQECARYKATEWRLLLFYVGPLILKQFLKTDDYNNFLCLHVAVRLLCDNEFNKTAEMVSYAKSLFKCFVDFLLGTYGPDFISFNLHNLLHLTDDAQRFGSLDNFSAFAFENYMQKIKKMIRKNEKPLEQIINRVSESELLKINSVGTSNQTCVQQHSEGPLLPNCSSPQFKIFQLEMSWAVVVFFTDDSVEVVPSPWIVRKECFWPSHLKGSKLREAITTRTSPKDDWKIFKIKVLKTYDDFKVASTKCEKARKCDELSSASTDAPRKSSSATFGKGRRIPMGKHFSDYDCDSHTSGEDYHDQQEVKNRTEHFPKSQFVKRHNYQLSEDEDLEQEVINKRAEKFPKNPFVKPNNDQQKVVQQAVNADVQIINMDSNTIQEKVLATANQTNCTNNEDKNVLSTLCLKLDEFFAQNKEFQKQCLRKFVMFDNRLREITENLETLMNLRSHRDNTPETDVNEAYFHEQLQLFPLENDVAVQQIETILEDEANMNKFAKQFSRVGGNTVKETTRAIMYRCISNQIGATYSFQGFKKKKIFKSLLLFQLILRSVRLNKNTSEATEKDVIENVKGWLAQAKFRGKGSVIADPAPAVD